MVRVHAPSMLIQDKFPGLVDALIQVESEGDDNAIGDKGLWYPAYGCLQIRHPYVKDVNRVFETEYNEKECIGRRTLSIEIFEKYMSIYARSRLIGRDVTAEDVARIHNGGPTGWKKVVTEVYWEKVKKHYNP